MKVLLTGHDGYIGAVATGVLTSAGHEVVGLDTGYFRDCTFGEQGTAIESLRMDVRDVTEKDLAGFDAVVHLAALSNDPLGELNAELTYDINYRASVRLAEMAKRAGAQRFLFSYRLRRTRRGTQSSPSSAQRRRRPLGIGTWRMARASDR